MESFFTRPFAIKSAGEFHRYQYVVVLSLAGAAMAEARTVRQGGRPSIFAPPVTPAGPLVGVVNAMVTAFNNQDKAYFQKMIAPDAIWFDEDGHHMAAVVWMNRILSATPPETHHLEPSRQ